MQRRITRSTPTKSDERPIPHSGQKTRVREGSLRASSRHESSDPSSTALRAIHSDWLAPTRNLERLRLRTPVHRSLSQGCATPSGESAPERDVSSDFSTRVTYWPRHERVRSSTVGVMPSVHVSEHSEPQGSLASRHADASSSGLAVMEIYGCLHLLAMISARFSRADPAHPDTSAVLFE